MCNTGYKFSVFANLVESWKLWNYENHENIREFYQWDESDASEVWQWLCEMNFPKKLQDYLFELKYYLLKNPLYEYK